MEQETDDSPRGSGDSGEEPRNGATKLRVIVIGGSVAGLACAHALLKTGVCRVMVIEKARALSGNNTGAGLGIDAAACEAMEDWGLRDELHLNSKPLDYEENRAVDPERKVSVKLARDENFRHWAVHWGQLHRILRESLPPGIVHFNHEAISFEDSEDGKTMLVKVVEGGSNNNLHAVKEVWGDLIVAADGSVSRTRQFYVPGDKRRYSGYCAWRGVYDYSDNPEIRESIQKVYGDIGHCLYFDIARGSHAVLYELPGQRLNWLWYVNQPEPHLEGDSVTIPQPGKEEVAKLHKEADRTWGPELAELIRVTPDPFINAIYDKNPLKQLVFSRVVLVGDAAHPTTPHGLRSTNMAIMDAHVLGKAVGKWGSRNLDSALTEYQMKRLSATSQQALFSRHLGRLKQGMLFEPQGSFPWSTCDEGMVEGLLQRNMSYYQWRCYVD
ncbi:hypothetical protein R1sor_015792 [Riccia sorocarpa]|uniref:FAD-binding domain-containing protein n=1 Tax=Riccia sorocarpa TaxID=122646 RepID=A0ABD3HDL0_9MARC